MDAVSLGTVFLVQSPGRIAGAARTLNVDPLSVSRTLGAVEADLAIRLFARTARRLTVIEELDVGRMQFQWIGLFEFACVLGVVAVLL